MNNKKNIDQLLESFITEERNKESNPFLSTRIMASINKKQNGQLLAISPVWKPVLIATGIMIAVFSGIATGSLYQSKNDAADIILINDNSMENFGMYHQIGNE